MINHHQSRRFDMSYKFRSPSARPTHRQTYGLFKLTGVDMRSSIDASVITRREFSDLMNEVYQHKDAGNSRDACAALAERLLANYASVKAA